MKKHDILSIQREKVSEIQGILQSSPTVWWQLNYKCLCLYKWLWMFQLYELHLYESPVLEQVLVLVSMWNQPYGSSTLASKWKSTKSRRRPFCRQPGRQKDDGDFFWFDASVTRLYSEPGWYSDWLFRRWNLYNFVCCSRAVLFLSSGWRQSRSLTTSVQSTRTC